jgi:hypothetical protein
MLLRRWTRRRPLVSTSPSFGFGLNRESVSAGLHGDVFGFQRETLLNPIQVGADRSEGDMRGGGFSVFSMVTPSCLRMLGIREHRRRRNRLIGGTVSERQRAHSRCSGAFLPGFGADKGFYKWVGN